MQNGNENLRSVLFVCMENSCRSQMAEALFNNMHVKGVKAYSAGSRPSGEVNILAIEVMKEIGINISYYLSKGIDSLPLKQFDYIVGMGCKDACPLLSAKKYIEWQISDPKGKDIDFFRKTRDEIRGKIKELVKTISKKAGYEK